MKNRESFRGPKWGQTRAARPPKQRNVQSLVFWVFSPWMRYKLKKLKRFDGRETYTAQIKRVREIEVLEACLLHS